MGKQRLELTWIGKNTRPKLESRILIEDSKKSYGLSETDNMLIHGDNLLALKALEQDYSGKIKCIYIDPPYNTGNAFEHYDDGLEHSIWLSLIRDRLLILRNLLTDDGSIWISIDDSEMAYLKVLGDEVFGRNNFVTTIIWQQRTTRENRKVFSNNHEYILLFAKNYSLFKDSRNDLPLNDEVLSRYKNPDNDPRGPWQSVSLNAQAGHATPSQFYTLTAPNGKQHELPKGRCWLYTEDKLKSEILENNIWFGRDGNGAPRQKKFLKDAKSGLTPETLWFASDVSTNDKAKKNLIQMFHENDEVFDTPKPEELIERIIHIGSSPGDYILDSFLGSGTTAAVAHKMGRKWIGIELGDHCTTHCKPRMDMVIAGEEQGGISKSIEWQGGGGYKFYELAPSLLNKDTYGNWIINQEYNADMLAAAMAKQEGFRYSPDPDIYWKQGQSTEQDFIFTTTEFLTQEHVEFIHSQMKEGESLLICCKAFNANDSHFPNITIKKIPKMLMGKCEFGKDDYSLNIINIPIDDNEEDFPDSVSEPKPKYVAGQAELFDLEGDNE